MGLFDWFRKRRKKKIDEEKELLERTGKLQTEMEMHVKKERRKRKKKRSV